MGFSAKSILCPSAKCSFPLDPTHIPFDRLALQEALEFQRPAAEESIPLLQAVALQQGHILPWPQASQLYQSPFSYENWAPVTTGAKPPANVSSLARGGGDLRHSLMQLQCLASRSSRQGNWESVNSALLLQQEEKRDEGARLSQDLKQLQRAADALSCADAFVTRKEATHRAVRAYGVVQSNSERANARCRQWMDQLERQSINSSWSTSI